MIRVVLVCLGNKARSVAAALVERLVSLDGRADSHGTRVSSLVFALLSLFRGTVAVDAAAGVGLVRDTVPSSLAVALAGEAIGIAIRVCESAVPAEGALLGLALCVSTVASRLGEFAVDLQRHFSNLRQASDCFSLCCVAGTGHGKNRADVQKDACYHHLFMQFSSTSKPRFRAILEVSNRYFGRYYHRVLLGKIN